MPLHIFTPFSSLPNIECKVRRAEMNTNKKTLRPAEVVIFNHEHFNNNNNEFRSGSAKDVELLQTTFKKLKCGVTIIQDATVKQVRSTVKLLEQKNLEDHSALVVVILSHGQRHETIAAYDGTYDLNSDIIHPISRNNTLNGKPKILFIQACKGVREVTILKGMVSSFPDLPCNVLKCFSSYEGFVSYRWKDGTPFVRQLCETLEESPHVDIVTNMDRVRLLVMQSTNNAQVPSVTHSLRTKYAFGDYI
ncbi:caspase isoform X2 [Drosophila mojavensis]|uniref:Uncharacterized protein, isoform C n=1 Tax=Drosophila mojavensis TaxID=7230 RepID=A0A0Q9XAB9_DROMO|nr:caspase isoform X2 [Drosophila mojavensis]KRG05451.1 uncharacterized protein Dmoj_GI18391, isoform C [Drosophila mojavensis]